MTQPVIRKAQVRSNSAACAETSTSTGTTSTPQASAVSNRAAIKRGRNSTEPPCGKHSPGSIRISGSHKLHPDYAGHVCHFCRHEHEPGYRLTNCAEPTCNVIGCHLCLVRCESCTDGYTCEDHVVSEHGLANACFACRQEEVGSEQLPEAAAA